ncbi:uncharacterized protein LOC134837836 [Culicoides brevitarsis]|uniref:uncharacterized protein LOC134837836 n=1 Tax=Culicoides brevitarsis TaxID=469753 RepID=UPI00307BEA84
MTTVEEEYRKNPELKKEDVQELLTWGTTQPHLPKISEFEAIQFLHSNYFNVDAAKKTAENYYTMRTQFTGLFSDNDTESAEMKQAHDTVTLACLPQTTPEGYRVIFARLKDADPAACDFMYNLKLYLLMMDWIITQQGTCNGYVLLYDMTGTSFGHMFKVNIMGMKQYLAYVQEAMPIRLKMVEHINMPSFIDKLIAICRPFMKKELMSLLKYRKNIEDAYETVPAEIWPKDFPNGTSPSIEELHESWWDKIKSRREETLFHERPHNGENFVDKRHQVEKVNLSHANWKSFLDVMQAMFDGEEPDCLSLVKWVGNSALGQQFSFENQAMKWLEEIYHKQNSALRKDDVREIEQWLLTEANVPDTLEEYQIVLFLHSNYFDIENTKKTIKNYYKYRADYTEFFNNLDLNSEKLQNAHDIVTFCVLPELTHNQHKVLLVKLHNTDPAALNFAEALKLFCLVVDIMLYEEGPPEGFVIAFDMTGIKFGHVLKLGIFTIKHFLNYLQGAMPVRIKGLQFFNTVPCTSKIVALCRPFMSQELYEMLNLHESIETVFPHIPQECFPKDYNGQAMSLEQFHVAYYKTIHLHQNLIFDEEEKHKELAELMKSNNTGYLWSMFK